jgi:predicted phosphodiesterase
MIEKFARIVKDYGIIKSSQYDDLNIPGKPSRRALCRKFGSWQECLEKVLKPITPQQNNEILRLTKQVEELSRHLQTTQLQLDGRTHRFGYITDTHIGSLFADISLLETAYKIFESEGITKVLHSGDMCDGIKVYKGHEFELSTNGEDAQINLVSEKYPKINGIITYFITGNHDRSFWKLTGSDIGQKIQSKRPDMVYLGYQEANIVVGEGKYKATIRLTHPEDGTAYAYSYKVQKYIAELPSGTKPDVLLIGHYHKAEMLYYRGVVAFQGGTTQHQTPFMRGRKISAAMGFWTLDITVGPNRIISVASKFYPVRS